jgi:hypothetical protein
MRLRQSQFFRSCAITGSCVALAALAPLDSSTAEARVARTPPTLAEPITDAAAYIGVTAASLAAEIVNETMRTGLPGTDVAIEQLDAAMARQLSTLTPGTDANTIFATQAIIATHHAIRNAILSQTVTVLQGALSG